MSRLPRIEARRLLAALRRHGFVLVSQKGSHVKLRHADGRMVIVPVHAGRVLKPRLLQQVLEIAGIPEREL